MYKKSFYKVVTPTESVSTNCIVISPSYSFHVFSFVSVGAYERRERGEK